MRSIANNQLCLRHGAHWFMNQRLFAPGFDHEKLLTRIEEELDMPANATKPARPHSEVFINHYYVKYDDPYLPPAWMIGETLSLGAWSQIYANLGAASDRKAIAAPFGYDESILARWLHTLAYVRNLCAHHSRLWNRKLVIKAPIPRKHTLRIQTNSADRFYAVAVVSFDLLRAVEPATQWNHRLTALLAQHAIVRHRLGEMGFPVPWKNDPFWDLKSPDPDPACWI